MIHVPDKSGDKLYVLQRLKMWIMEGDERRWFPRIAVDRYTLLWKLSQKYSQNAAVLYLFNEYPSFYNQADLQAQRHNPGSIVFQPCRQIEARILRSLMALSSLALFCCKFAIPQAQLAALRGLFLACIVWDGEELISALQLLPGLSNLGLKTCNVFRPRHLTPVSSLR